MAVETVPAAFALFHAAFTQSRNAMALVNSERTIVDVNAAYARMLGCRRDEIVGHPLYERVVGGPLRTPAQWRTALASAHFTGRADLHCADGGVVAVQWAATTETVSGRRLVLFVALNTSRWGSRFRRPLAAECVTGTLSAREREVVRLIALGSTGPEIADELGIAHETVRTHVRNAMDKAGARSRAHLVARALGDGLVLG
jgi:PAS domain S-box-containing protein